MSGAILGRHALTLTACALGLGMSGIGLAEDTTPDPFSFPDVVFASPNAYVVSAPVTITGIDVPVRAAVSPGHRHSHAAYLSIGCTGTFYPVGTIENGQTICLRAYSGSWNFDAWFPEVSVGASVGRLRVVTGTDDVTPDPFAAAPRTHVPPASWVEFDPVTVTGLSSRARVTIRKNVLSGPDEEVSIGCTGSYSSGDQVIHDGQTLCVRHVSATVPDTVRNTVLQVGDFLTAFSSSTGAGFDATPDPFVVAPRIGVRRSGIASRTVVVSGLAGTAPIAVANGWLDWSQPPFVRHESPSFTVTQSTPAAFDGANVTTISVGGVSATFSATTIKRRLYTDGSLRDFDGDGFEDLVWRNTSTGDTALWRLDSGFYLQGAPALSGRPEWSVTHVADFDGDHRSDLVWRNATTGETAIWLMDGLGMRAGAIVVAQPDWTVTHVGDFDADGRSDLVWLNARTGATVVWLVSGLGFHDSATLLMHPDWRVQSVADLDGDGRSDLIWRNPSTGQTAAWLMNGKAMASGAILVSHPAWRVVANADLDGDGSDDLVWHNAATGQTAIWLMDGTAMREGAIVPARATQQVVMAADRNADGKSDLLVRDTATGLHDLWIMDGLVRTETVPLPANVVRLTDFDGDGEADRLERLGDGQYVVCCFAFGSAPLSAPGWTLQ